MARDYLAILASSVPAKRIFSSTSDIVTQDRACLSADTIHAIMCLKH
jgi:hAT family protein